MSLVYAIILFAVGALGGLAMAVMHFRTRSSPHALLAAVHGLFAAAGLITLAWIVVKVGGNRGTGIALGLFLLAALGGFALLSFHLRGRPLPGAIVIGHGLIAGAAFVVLFVSAMALGA